MGDHMLAIEGDDITVFPPDRNMVNPTKALVTHKLSSDNAAWLRAAMAMTDDPKDLEPQLKQFLLQEGSKP